MIGKVPNLNFLLRDKWNIAQDIDMAAVGDEEYAEIFGVQCPRFSAAGLQYLTLATEYSGWVEGAGKTFIFLIRPRWGAPPDAQKVFFCAGKETEFMETSCYLPFIYLQAWEDVGAYKLAWTVFDWDTMTGYLKQITLIDEENWSGEDVNVVVCRVEEDNEIDLWLNGTKATSVTGTPLIIPALEDIFLGAYYLVFGEMETVMYHCDADIHLSIFQEALPDVACESYYPAGGIQGLYRGVLDNK